LQVDANKLGAIFFEQLFSNKITVNFYVLSSRETQGWKQYEELLDYRNAS